ncbi:MAG: DMT family transporter [Proteobacteria bacterium]|nr:DMT family transporter [Pseudomonadota bacterium]
MTGIRQENIRAAGLLTLSTVFFSVNDATMKYAAQELPMLQAMAIRGVMVTLGLGILAYMSGALLRWPKLADPVVVARSGFETVGSFAFMLSLPHIPLATAISLNMATPLSVLPLAAIFLGERFGWRRIAAIVAGFIGVMLILQPSTDGVDPWLLLSFSSSIFFAMRDVSTRRISADIPSLLIALAMAGIVTVATGIWSLIDGWAALDGRKLALLALAAVMVGFGYTLVVKAMRLGEVSFTGAFRYTALLWATIFGWAVWRETPNATAWAGIALILAAGLYALHRERVRARQQ